MTETNLTTESKKLLEKIIKDLPNWNGITPCYNHITKETRGNLTDLKKKGFVTTFIDEGEEWIQVTDEGKEFAKIFG